MDPVALAVGIGWTTAGLLCLALAIPLRFLTGVALAGVYPPGLKLMTSWFDRGRGFALGVLVGHGIDRRRDRQDRVRRAPEQAHGEHRGREPPPGPPPEPPPEGDRSGGADRAEQFADP